MLRLWGVGGEDCGQLPGGHALQLNDRWRWRCSAVVQDPLGEGGGKQTHLHLVQDTDPAAREGNDLQPMKQESTADEGYDGVPFPRPVRELTRPSFLPDSDDGGMDPGQALRNDGLNPPRPPTLRGRLRESGIQAAETIIAGGAAGAVAATRAVSENQTLNVLRGGGDWLDRTLRIPRRPAGLGPPPNKVPATANHRAALGSGTLAGERAGQRAAEVERAAAQDIEQFATQQLAEAEASKGFATAAEAAAGAAEAAAAAEGGGVLAALGEGALATAGAVGAARGGLAVGTAWALWREGSMRPRT